MIQSDDGIRKIRKGECKEQDMGSGELQGDIVEPYREEHGMEGNETTLGRKTGLESV